MAVGRIHSCESFGTVDGPGIRYVVFMQGCPLRCLYCHNPDTWEIGGGKEMTADEILAEFKHNEAFYKHGGITVSGGEPLLQVDFLLELFEKAKKSGIHTCIDTSGATFDRGGSEYREKIDRLMGLTDLVMLDIKHIDSETHKKLTGKGNENILAFAKYLSDRQIPLWVRHVVVKGYTDGEEEHKALGRFLATLHDLRALDVLPYHTMGVGKYKELGIPYALEGMEAASYADAEKAKKEILSEYFAAKKK
ncbi:MAG: pyruvate formate lyase-activating protein [Clostridia bacterium]|nr:pyruvate formate lyase-activating protein [Clostridia bacterium]